MTFWLCLPQWPESTFQELNNEECSPGQACETGQLIYHARKYENGSLVLVLPKHYLGFRDYVLSPSSTCTLNLSLSPIRHENFAIELAKSSNGRHFIKIDRVHPSRAGLFLSTNGQETLIRSFKGMNWPPKSEYLRLTVQASSRELSLVINGKRHSLAWSGDPGNISPRLVRNESSQTFLAAIDRISLLEASQGAQPRVLVDHAFAPPIFTLDLPNALGLREDGKAARTIGLLVLILIAMGVDLLLLAAWRAMPRVRGWSRLTEAGFLTLLFPFLFAVVVAARMGLRLPLSSALIAIVVAGMVKYWILAREGFAGRGRITTLQAVALGGLGLALHLAVMILLLLPSNGSSSPHSVLPWLITVLPPVSLVLAMLLTKEPPLEGFVLSALGYLVLLGLLPWLGESPRTAYIVPSFFWLLGMMVHALKQPRWPGILAVGHAGLGLVMLLCFLEVGLAKSRYYLEHGLTDTINAHYLYYIGLPEARELGMRQEAIQLQGGSYAIDPIPGTYRVLCVGSSSTAGVGAWPRNKSFPAQLEVILKDKTSRPVEVINGGMEGASFFQIRTHFERVQLRLKPDLVIVYFGANMDKEAARVHYSRAADILRDNPYIKTKEQIWAAMTIKAHQEWVINGFLTATRSQMVMGLVSFAEYLHGGMPRLDSMDYDGKGRILDPRTPADIVRLCRERGIKVLLIPEITSMGLAGHYGQSPDKQYHYTEIFRSLAEKNGKHGVLFEPLWEEFTPELGKRYLVDRMHLNADGYRYLAEKIATILLTKGLVPTQPAVADQILPGRQGVAAEPQ